MGFIIRYHFALFLGKMCVLYFACIFSFLQIQLSVRNFYTFRAFVLWSDSGIRLTISRRPLANVSEPAKMIVTRNRIFSFLFISFFQ